MADFEKTPTSHNSMSPAPADRAGPGSFRGQYEGHVNDNMQGMHDVPLGTVQAFDGVEEANAQRTSKLERKKRQAIYAGIALLIVIILTLVLVLVLGRQRGDKDGPEAEKALPQAMTVTQTATASSTSSPSISVSVSVSMSTSISTHISMTTETETKTTIKTVATTAPTPRSILDAATSWIESVKSSISADLASGRSIESAALTKDPASISLPAKTFLTTTTPPPETVVETTMAPPPTTGTPNVLCPEDVWFC